MLCRLPLVRSSTTLTRALRSTRASTRWDPIKEAPPVTRTSRSVQNIQGFSVAGEQQPPVWRPCAPGWSPGTLACPRSANDTGLSVVACQGYKQGIGDPVEPLLMALFLGRKPDRFFSHG